jgi:mono/diheme cytochrome c family protein
MVAAAVALFLLAAPATAPLSAQAEAGGRLATMRCAACHAVGPAGASPNLSATPFRDIRLRYSTLSLERELVKISKQGHFEMRPTQIDATQASDLAAYIETLGPAGR